MRFSEGTGPKATKGQRGRLCAVVDGRNCAVRFFGKRGCDIKACAEPVEVS